MNPFKIFSFAALLTFPLMGFGCGGGGSGTPADSSSVTIDEVPGESVVVGEPANVQPEVMDESATSEPVAGTRSPSDAGAGTSASTDPNTTPEQAAGPQPPAPEVTATAIQFQEEYDQDQEQWKSKYAGNTVQLTGAVTGYKSGKPDSFELNLKLLLGKFPEIDVAIQEDRPWLKYPPGSTVVVVGDALATPLSGLDDAFITSSEPGPEIRTVTEADLAAMERNEVFAIEPVRYVYLKGTFRRYADDYDESGLFYCGTGDEDQVMLQAQLYVVRRSRHLQPGDAINVLGQASREEGELTMLSPAYLIEPISALPPTPERRVRGNKYGREFVHLLFTPDLLSNWIQQDPRALQILFINETFYSPVGVPMEQVEVTGEYASSAPNPYDADKVDVKLKSDASVDIRFVCGKNDSELADLKPGTPLTIRGRYNFSYADNFAYIDDCLILRD